MAATAERSVLPSLPSRGEVIDLTGRLVTAAPLQRKNPLYAEGPVKYRSVKREYRWGKYYLRRKIREFYPRIERLHDVPQSHQPFIVLEVLEGGRIWRYADVEFVVGKQETISADLMRVTVRCPSCQDCEKQLYLSRNGKAPEGGHVIIAFGMTFRRMPREFIPWYEILTPYARTLAPEDYKHYRLEKEGDAHNGAG